MKEELVSFKTALLAKEKGFNHLKANCFGDNMAYQIDSEKLLFANNASIMNGGYVLAPTQSLLQKWLREKHNIFVISLPWRDHQTDNNDSYEFRPMIVGRKTFDCYKKYEEALEKGLYEALKLIKV